MNDIIGAYDVAGLDYLIVDGNVTIFDGALESGAREA